METTIEQIKMLNLTDDDFKLIVDALEFLPHKDIPSEMMKDLITTMIAKDADEAARKMEKRRLEIEAGHNKKRILIENIKILQGKLLMLKRYLQQNDGLKQAYEAINLKP